MTGCVVNPASLRRKKTGCRSAHPMTTPKELVDDNGQKFAYIVRTVKPSSCLFVSAQGLGTLYRRQPGQGMGRERCLAARVYAMRNFRCHTGFLRRMQEV